MTFVKGKSGNPSGRKKEDPVVKEMFSKYLPDAIKAVETCLKDDNPSIRLKAADIIFDRSLGKPAQAVEHSGQVDTKAVLEIAFTGSPNKT